MNTPGLGESLSHHPLLALATYRNILQKAEAKEIQYVNGVAGGFVREEVLAKR